MLIEKVDFSAAAQTGVARIARINGVALNRESEDLSVEALRQRASTELLRQAAIGAGLLDAEDRKSVV